jgi:hypothetical protein
MPHVSAKHALMVLKTAQVSWTGIPIAAAAALNKPTTIAWQKAITINQTLSTAVNASVKSASAHQAKSLPNLAAAVHELSR